MVLFGFIWYILVLISIVWVVYDTWAVNRKDSTGMKIAWTILAVLFSVITAIVYYFVRKK